MRKRVAAGILMAGLLLAAGTRPVRAEQEADTYGKYHAALGVQTEAERRVFRDAYFDGRSEKREDFQELKRERSQGSGAERAESSQGDFQDVTIKGNGTYTVSLKNADFHGQRTFRKLYVATDIPNTREIKFSNMSVSIDGEVLRTFEKPVLDVSRTYRKNCVLLAIHPVNEEVQDDIPVRSVPRGRENIIKIRFTVTGFDYDKGEKPQRPTPEPSATPEVTQAPEQGGEASPVPETSVPPKKEAMQKETSEELPAENKAGIVVTIVAAIGGVLICLAVVSRRNR